MRLDLKMEKMYGQFAEYFDELFAYKDYPKEARFIEWAVTKKRSEGNNLLDIGCGSGTHLNLLRKRYNIFGIDKSSQMIKIARQKVKGGKFFVKDMKTFSLNHRFDTIICMFSAINYNLNYSELESSLKRMRDHLNSGGVLIFDLYNNTDTYKPDTVRVRTLRKKNLDLAVISQPKVTGTEYKIGYIYLAKRDGKTELFIDDHVRGIFEVSKVYALMKRLGFKTKIYGDYSSRAWRKGKSSMPLFVGIKQVHR